MSTKYADKKTGQTGAAPEAGRKKGPAEVIADLLKPAGILINGNNPWDIQVHNEEFYERVLSEGSLGFGESYMEGWWDCGQLDEMVSRTMAQNLHNRINRNRKLILRAMKGRLFNLQSLKRAFQVGERHYDIGNDLYRAMLDPTMSYSCGYWKDAGDLHQAQRNKLDLLCRKLDLQPREHLLDIGCGWGGMAQYAAENYSVKVTGVTVSKEQKALAEQRCRKLPVEILLKDYREVTGTFDKVVSVGMFEHVGPKNYPTFMKTVDRLLKEKGVFLLHSITSQDTPHHGEPWIDRYIFPNGFTPSLTQISRACEPYFIIEDVHNFGPDYDRTLMAWHTNFDHAWPALQDKYGDTFYRMWTFYLKGSAGAFRSGEQQLLQLVLRRRRPNRTRFDCPR